MSLQFKFFIRWPTIRQNDEKAAFIDDDEFPFYLRKILPVVHDNLITRDDDRKLVGRQSPRKILSP